MTRFPHLRLVDKSPRDEESGFEFDAVEHEPHDLHGAYHELDAAPLHLIAGEDEDGNDADAEVQAAARRALSARFVVVALIAFQLMVAMSYLGKYFALTRGGDEYLVAAILSLPASLCLYVGALLLAFRPGRGRVWFIVAAVGLGLSLPAWGVSYGWTWPMAFGAMLGLAGAWYARAAIESDS